MATPNIKPVASLLAEALEQGKVESLALDIPLFNQHGARISVLRLGQFELAADSITALPISFSTQNCGLSGNKLFKLLPSLIDAKLSGKTTLLTFGGAWSNHLYATAKAAAAYQLKSVGIVRGERPANLSATLNDARKAGMDLYFVPRGIYRNLSASDTACELSLIHI